MVHILGYLAVAVVGPNVDDPISKVNHHMRAIAHHINLYRHVDIAASPLTYMGPPIDPTYFIHRYITRASTMTIELSIWSPRGYTYPLTFISAAKWYNMQTPRRGDRDLAVEFYNAYRLPRLHNLQLKFQQCADMEHDEANDAAVMVAGFVTAYCPALRNVQLPEGPISFRSDCIKFLAVATYITRDIAKMPERKQITINGYNPLCPQGLNEPWHYLYMKRCSALICKVAGTYACNYATLQPCIIQCIGCHTRADGMHDICCISSDGYYLCRSCTTEAWTDTF